MLCYAYECIWIDLEAATDDIIKHESGKASLNINQDWAMMTNFSIVVLTIVLDTLVLMCLNTIKQLIKTETGTLHVWNFGLTNFVY